MKNVILIMDDDKARLSAMNEITAGSYPEYETVLTARFSSPSAMRRTF